MGNLTYATEIKVRIASVKEAINWERRVLCLKLDMELKKILINILCEGVAL